MYWTWGRSVPSLFSLQLAWNLKSRVQESLREKVDAILDMVVML